MNGSIQDRAAGEASREEAAEHEHGGRREELTTAALVSYAVAQVGIESHLPSFFLDCVCCWWYDKSMLEDMNCSLGNRSAGDLQWQPARLVWWSDIYGQFTFYNSWSICLISIANRMHLSEVSALCVSHYLLDVQYLCDIVAGFVWI